MRKLSGAGVIPTERVPCSAGRAYDASSPPPPNSFVGSDQVRVTADGARHILGSWLRHCSSGTMLSFHLVNILSTFALSSIMRDYFYKCSMISNTNACLASGYLCLALGVWNLLGKLIREIIVTT